MPYRDPLKKKEHRKQYYLAHREQEKAAMALWRQNNPDRRREINRRFRQKRKEMKQADYNWYLEIKNKIKQGNFTTLSLSTEEYNKWWNYQESRIKRFLETKSIKTLPELPFF